MFEILYEDSYILIVNKKSGVNVESDNYGNKGLDKMVEEYLIQKSLKKVFVGIPHRLDKPTSGIVVFALKKSVLIELNKMFETRQIHKSYLALVSVKPKKDNQNLIHFLNIDKLKNISTCSDFEIKDSKKAILNYKYLKSSQDIHLLEINLQTGRHHQIRTQLSKIGSPIIGDLKYGSNLKINNEIICLHSHKISFIHPFTKQKMFIIAKTPNNNYWNLF